MVPVASRNPSSCLLGPKDAELSDEHQSLKAVPAKNRLTYMDEPSRKHGGLEAMV